MGLEQATRTRIRAATLVALVAALLLASSAAGAPAKGQPRSMLWGAWIGDQITGEEAPWDMRALDRFQSKLGRGLSLLEFSAPFAYCNADRCHRYEFPTEQMQKIRRYGAIPFFSWNSGYTGEGQDDAFQLADITSGSHDSQVRAFAEEAKRWGKPFFLRFNWEMNGSWFPWSEGVNGNAPGSFVAAWRHVHDIFRSVGADNATWVWCPYAYAEDNGRSLTNLYPGDAYLDWTCLDAYNWGRNQVESIPWMSFDKMFSYAYREVTTKIAPSKPMIIGEVASNGSGRDKARWIRGMFQQLRTGYDKIHGVIWFNQIDRGVKWALERQPAAARAFRIGIRRGFRPNAFSTLAESPIPPPIKRSK